MFQFGDWTLRTRVMVLSAVLLAPSLILLFLVLETVSSKVDRQFRTDTVASYSLASERLQRVFLDTQSDLAALANSRQLATGDATLTAQMLRTLYLSRREVQVVFAADASGDVFSSSHNLHAPRRVNVADKPYFAEVVGRGQTSIHGPMIDPLTNQVTIVIVVPLRNEIGRPIGLVAAVISVFRLHDLMEQFLTRAGDRLLVYQAATEPIVSVGWSSSGDRERWLHRFAPQVAGIGDQVNLQQFHEWYLGPVALLANGRVTGTPFQLALVREGGPFDLALGSTLSRGLIYSVLALVLTLVIASKIGVWGSMPLETLTAAVDRITEGHLDADVTEPASDAETRKLVNAFNLMSASLREREAQLALQRQELHQYSLQLRDLLAQVLHAQEEERHRISVDLHDTVAQQITGVHYEIQAALGHQRYGDELGAAAALVRATAILRDVSSEMRRVIHLLRPPALERHGLGPALHELARSYSSLPRQIQVTTTVDGEPVPLAWPQQMALYRVAQESLNNAWKHAPGAAVTVRLSYTETGTELRVSDNGNGFVFTTDAESQPPRLGIVGMYERMEQAGGELNVISAPGKGTTIIARITLVPDRTDYRSVGSDSLTTSRG